MTLRDWIDGKEGRLSWLARHFAISRQAVFQWAEKGVPAKRMLEVNRVTRGDVTLRDMARQREG